MTMDIRVIGSVVVCAALIAFPATSFAGSEWGRNPFEFGKQGQTEAIAGEIAKPKPETLTVEMTLEHEQVQLAVVNGRKVKIGDIVDGARVTSITVDGVTFMKNGKAVTKPVGGD